MFGDGVYARVRQVRPAGGAAARFLRQIEQIEIVETFSSSTACGRVIAGMLLSFSLEQ